MSTTTTDALAVHRAVLGATASEGPSSITRVPTDAEMALVDQWLARTPKDAQDFAAYLGMSETDAAELRRLLEGNFL